MLDYRMDTFLSLCETKSYTKTAKKMCISQPCVSQHIKYLEHYYGCRLFHYDGRILELTDEGKYLYQKEIGVLSSEQEIRERIRQMKVGVHLRVGMTPTVNHSFVPKSLAIYMTQHTEMQFQFIIADAHQLRQQLANGAMDIAFMEEIFLNQTIFERYFYEQESLILVANPHVVERLYGKPVSAILKETLLIPPEGSGLRDNILHWLHVHNLALNDFQKVIVVNSMTLMQKLLTEKAGISFLFVSTVQEDLQKHTLQRLQMDDFFLNSNFQYVYLKDSLSKDFYLQCLQDVMHISYEQGDVLNELQLTSSKQS
jgi:DNA-binding transcriptional LysR family regulator